VVDGGRGQAELAYGVTISIAKLEGNPPAGQDALQAATQKLITSMEEENADLRITRDPKPVTLNGERALSIYFTNDSPNGGQETDWLLTVMRPEGLVYFVCVAPREDYNAFNEAFTNVLDSVRFKR